MKAFGRILVCGVFSLPLFAVAVGCDPVAPFSFLSSASGGGAVPGSSDGDVAAGNSNESPDEVSPDGVAVTDPDEPSDVSEPDEIDAPDDADETAPTAEDTDGDGFTDDEEQTALPGSDPENPDDTPENPIDSDGDGCSDYDEVTFQGFCDANPNSDDVAVFDDPSAAHTFSLTVVRHTDVPFTDAQVDAVFAAGGALLKTADPECPDIATDSTFERNGSLTTFDVGGAVLTAESQLDTVFGVVADVKVVDFMVGVCGVPQTDDMSVVLGCASIGGSLVITATAAPDVWVHEWGHVQGLLHRDDCPRNIMHAFEVETNAVNERERNAFLTPTPRFGKVALGADPESPGAVARLRRYVAEPTRAWLRRVVDTDFLAGVPSGVMEDLSSEAVGDLVEMLDAPEFAGRRRNVVRMLGFTKNAAACDVLEARVSGPAGEVDFDGLAVACESILAVGRLAAHDPNGEALRWLMAGCDPATWQARGVDWHYRAHGVEAIRNLLARVSIKALGISGHDDALAHLRSLTSEEFSPQVIEAIAWLTKGDATQKRAHRPTRQP